MIRAVEVVEEEEEVAISISWIKRKRLFCVVVMRKSLENLYLQAI